MIHDQATHLRRQFDKDGRYRQAKTISIVSGKGGVGKSNFAINFSLALIKQRKRVLLIDLDIGMGNIDILLGLQAERTIIDMLNDYLPVHEIIETGPMGLSYIAGGSGVTHFFSLNREKMDYFLSQYDELVTEYDYIIFDMGAGASSDSLFFILASDECILITTPEPTSITDAYSMVKHIIKKQQNLPIYVVINRVSSTKNGQQTLQKFKQVVSQFLDINIHPLGIIPEDKHVHQAVMHQTPYLIHNATSPVSKAILNIVKQYDTDLDVVDEPKFSFAQRLKQWFKVR